MEYVKLNNGVDMPILGLGTFQSTDPQVCEKSIIEAIQSGYRLIDTAQAYGNEEAVGTAIKNCGIDREELFITTKVWFRNYETEACRASLEESMRKLGVDYLDMVLLHWPLGNVYAAWRVLEDYYLAGKIRAIGVSNMDPDRIIDLITFNKIKPALNQIETHLYCQRQSDCQWMKKYGVVVQAYAPLGQGRAKQMFSEAEVQNLAAKYSKTPAQILLRFLTQLGVSVIPKSVHTERIKENINIFDFVLNEEEMLKLVALDTNKPMIGCVQDPELVEFAMTW